MCYQIRADKTVKKRVNTSFQLTLPEYDIYFNYKKKDDYLFPKLRDKEPA